MFICILYTGAYDDEEAAARAYDLAALKYWGPGTLINFPVSFFNYLLYSIFFIVFLLFLSIQNVGFFFFWVLMFRS